MGVVVFSQKDLAPFHPGLDIWHRAFERVRDPDRPDLPHNPILFSNSGTLNPKIDHARILPLVFHHVTCHRPVLSCAADEHVCTAPPCGPKPSHHTGTL